MIYRVSRPSKTWSSIIFKSRYLASFRFFLRFFSFLNTSCLCVAILSFSFCTILFVSIYFLCVFSFSLFFPSSSLCKHAHIFIYFCYPLFLANLSFQNIFINLLSFWVSLVIQTFKIFLFFFILLSFLLIFLVIQAFIIFINKIVLSFLLIQAFEASSLSSLFSPSY